MLGAFVPRKKNAGNKEEHWKKTNRSTVKLGSGVGEYDIDELPNNVGRFIEN